MTEGFTRPESRIYMSSSTCYIWW